MGSTPKKLRIGTHTGHRRARSDFFQQVFQALPGIFASFFVRFAAGWIFARAHEAMASAAIGDRLVRFAGFLHCLGCLGNCRVDAIIVFAVEAINWATDSREVSFAFRRGPVEWKCGFYFFVVRCVTERLAATPAESANDQFPVTRGKF